MRYPRRVVLAVLCWRSPCCWPRAGPGPPTARTPFSPPASCASAPRASTRRSAITTPPPANSTGYDVDVARAVGEKLGVNVEFVETPWDSIFAALEANRFDVVANQVTINDERQAEIRPVRAVLDRRGRDRHPRRRQLDHVAGRPQGQDRRAEHHQQLGAGRPRRRRADRVGGGLHPGDQRCSTRAGSTSSSTTASSVYAYLAETNDTAVKIAGTTGEKSEQGFAARKDSGLLPELNKALDELRADGTLAEISQKYLKTNASGGQDAAAGSAAVGWPTGARQPLAAGQGRADDDDPADHHQLHHRPGDRARGGAGPAVDERGAVATSRGSTSRSSAARRCWCSCSSCSSRCRSSASGSTRSPRR